MHSCHRPPRHRERRPLLFKSPPGILSNVAEDSVPGAPAAGECPPRAGGAACCGARHPRKGHTPHLFFCGFCFTDWNISRRERCQVWGYMHSSNGGWAEGPAASVWTEGVVVRAFSHGRTGLAAAGTPAQALAQVGVGRGANPMPSGPSGNPAASSVPSVGRPVLQAAAGVKRGARCYPRGPRRGSGVPRRPVPAAPAG